MNYVRYIWWDDRMRIILSRKGCDDENGGFPSPILPNNQLLSIPVPSDDEPIKYIDLTAKGYGSYSDILTQLLLKNTRRKRRYSTIPNSICHPDPDIYKKAMKRKKGWKGVFGQIDGEQTHLEKQGVTVGDIFLFFGTFSWTTKKEDGTLKYIKITDKMHIIFGYLQIGEIRRINFDTTVPQWMEYHPHCIDEDRLSDYKNTVYVAADHLSFDKDKPGYGIFYYSDDLVLTKVGHSKSHWIFPKSFKEKPKVVFSRGKFEKSYFKSPDIGQEIVIQDNPAVRKWAKRLIRKNARNE